MRLEKLLAYADIVEYGGDMSAEITEVTYDSRKIKPGALFAAIPGFKTDGHLFIEDALKRGASAIVIEDPAYKSDAYPWLLVTNSRAALGDLAAAVYDFPANKLNIVGVTGTNGKTTTTNLIQLVLDAECHQTGLIGTIHNRIGQEILPVEHTTPEAPDLQKLFLAFLEKGADYAVMEVSSHALDLQRTRGTEYDVAVFTNLTQDHLDFHKDMENYLAAKGKLFASLGVKSNKKRRKFAIINIDDPYGERIIEMTSAAVITYGVKKEADVRAEDVVITGGGASFTLKYTDKTLPVRLKMTGIFNVYNALAATAAGLVEGVPVEKIIATLESIPGIPGRFEKVDDNQNFTIIVDYSHTPDSLENCLKTARQFAKARIITVFGCGGDRDRTKRPLMGEVAGRLSDIIVVTSDNPRTEEPLAVIDDIIPGLARTAGSKEYKVIPDRRTAIHTAVKMAQPDDIVIIAGKGHETYQIIGQDVFPFDDRMVAKEALRSKLSF
ncbi:MAG: UDP-N-acetylmuramoyl-L-alanyl-D-glutamate--2,6-diaminopimelate ligase [Clostridia bacterium]|jgi:UDP-N-acetylmuramoyl-L-alanyl-D-glutamate--2,6-diaminopimelate ligase|nr:UDP-N-acetylmuramoyl-L-alanyl-D-glutamate--2,6-diaminopimelate ligase [Clostridia bacterium]